MKAIEAQACFIGDWPSFFVVERPGMPSLLETREIIFLILFKKIFRLNNRKAAYLLPVLGIAKGRNYKTVERLYYSPLEIMILKNLFIFSIYRMGVASFETSADGTCLSFTVTKNYFPWTRRKVSLLKKKGKFFNSFGLMDLATKVYMGYAVSVKSEIDGYCRVLEMIEKMRLDLRNFRLDKYYSRQSALLDFKENTRIFLILKKDSRSRGRKSWKEVVERFIDDTMNHLR